MSNILKGIQLNEVSPHDYDSDWDYQDAVARSGRPRSSYRSQEDDTFDSDVAYSRKIYQATKAAKEKAQRDADHNRLASGMNEEQLDELSPETLASYKKKAGAAATQADKQGDYKLGNKRFSGIVKATKKQFAQDEKNLKEFAADDGEGGEEDTLRKYAKLWYNGNLGTQQQVEQILDRMGWEIGELESEEGGAFVVQAGDENGDTYIGFTANDLTDNLDENLHKWFNEKWVRFGPDGKIRGVCARGDDSEGKPKCLPQAKAHALGKKGRKYAASKKRREDPNPERSGKAINVSTKKKSNESLDNPWGDQGNFAGDTPVNIGGVSVKKLTIGDIVSYFGQKAKILDMSKTGNTSRIVIPSSMGSITKDVLTKDLKRTSLSEEELDEACWKGYHKEGNKKMFGKTYPNCVKNEGVAEGSEAQDNLVSILNSFDYYSDNGKVYVNDAGDKIARQGSNWKHQSGRVGHGSEELGNFLSSKQGVAEGRHAETCPHCGGEMISEELMNEKKDACYYKVKSRYKVWPSAYASGALVKCRKKGASNWGTGGKSNESIEEGWKEEAQDLEDWSKEVNMRLYRAHESQRPALARQLSKLEQKHFGSEFTHPNLTNVVWSALRALQKGEMVHYDPQRVGQMPFGNIVGDDAKIIAQYNITRDELAGYRMLHDKGMVDNLEQFLKLRRLVRAKSWPLEYYEELEKLTPEEAWLKMANDLNWSKDSMAEEVQAKTDDKLLAYYAQRKAEKQKQQSQSQDQLDEKWTKKYKDSINCSNPKGFSQKAHCAGKKKNESAIMSGLNQLDEGWKEKLGAAALAGSMALGAQARVTPGDDPNINRLTGKPNTTQQATDTAPTTSSNATIPGAGLVRADSADRQAGTVTVDGQYYKMIMLSPTDLRPRGGKQIAIPQAVMGERGIGNYIGILIGDKVFVLPRNN